MAAAGWSARQGLITAASVVLARMIGSVRNFQVLGAVIGLVAVDVMDDFVAA